MADKKISELDAVTTATSQDTLVCVNGGVTKKIPAQRLLNPKMVISTCFETLGRFTSYTTGSGATSTLDANGSNLHTGTDTNSYGGGASITLSFPIGNRSTAELGSPSCSFHGMIGVGSDSQCFYGLGVGTSFIQANGVFTWEHIGFRVSRVSGGNINLYASQADGSTENSTLLTTLTNYDYLDLIFQVNGTSSVDYYYRVNSGALSSVTNLTSNIPTTLDGHLCVAIKNSKVASNGELYTTSMSVTR